MDVELTVGATGGGDYLQYKKWDYPPRPLHSAPEGPPYSRLDTPLVKLPTAPPTMSSDGHEIELSEFQSDRPPTVHYHLLSRGRGRSIKHDKPPHL